MRSIRSQLTLALLGTVLGLAAVCGSGFYAWTRHALLARFDAALLAKARALGALVQWDRDHLEVSPAEQLMPEFGAVRHPQYFQIRRADGAVVVRSPSMGDRDLPSAAGADETGSFRDLTLPDGRPGRTVAIQFRPTVEEEAGDAEIHRPASSQAGGDRRGARLEPQPLTLVLAEDQSDLLQMLRTLRWSLIAAGLVLAGAIVAAVTLVVRSGLSPLMRLAAQVRTIDVSSLSTRIRDENMSAELSPIAQRLNELLARLGAAFAREKRFTNDAAHELRTPIAELWALAEVGLSYPGDPATTRQSFEDAMEIARQMDAIVSTLLAVARAEAGPPMLAKDPVDLVVLVRETWHPLTGTAAGKEIQVDWDLPPTAVARADGRLLTIIIRNLLSNAVDHTPAGGCLHIDGRVNAGFIELGVTNTNTSLTPADLPHLGEPFWRKNASRSDTHRGLGLALALAYSKQMGLDLHFDLPQPDRFRAFVQVPFSGPLVAPPQLPRPIARRPASTPSTFPEIPRHVIAPGSSSAQ